MEFTEQTAGQSKEMPAKIVIYGEPKIGKTRFTSNAEDVFFLNIEGGLDYLDKEVRSTPKLNTYDEVIGWLRHIYENEHFTAGTIVLDSLDWLETLAQKKLVKQHNAKSIVDFTVAAFGYQKGVQEAAEMATKAIEWLDAIYKKKGIPCILIAHAQVKTIDLPNQDAYSRHELKLSKWLGAKANEWADLILFAAFKFHVADEGKTVSAPQRVLLGGEDVSYVGGGRMSLPNELPLDYNKLKEEITK